MGSDLFSVTSMAKYPFLPQARDHIAAVGINLDELGELEDVVSRAKERIEATFEFRAYKQSLEPYKRPEVEIASFPVAVLIVTGAEDKVLTERYALSEAKRMYRYLLGERDEEVILKIAKHFKWDVSRSKQGPYSYTMHFSNYVSNAASGRLVHAPEWKLVRRQLHNGQVSVTIMEICRLLQEEMRKYIEARAGEKTPKTQVIQDVIEGVKAEFMKRKPHLTEFDQIVRAEESEYPPCITSILERTTKGEHLSHAERFTLVTYLVHQGITVDGIVNLFSNVADFAEDKTRYQVEHLAGERGSGTAYKTYNCSTLQTHGICPNPSGPICKKIRNPLTYHVRKKATEQRVEED